MRWGIPGCAWGFGAVAEAPRIGTGAVKILQVAQQQQKYPGVGNPGQAEASTFGTLSSGSVPWLKG